MSFSPNEHNSTDYELEKLDYYLLELVNPSNQNYCDNFSQESSIIIEICSEIKKLSNKLQIRLFRATSEESTKLIVKNYQNRLNFYINSITDYGKHLEKQELKLCDEHYKRFQIKLAENISFIEKYYSDYFDYRSPANSICKQDTFNKIQNLVNSLSVSESIKKSKLFLVAFKPASQFLLDFNIKNYSYSQTKSILSFTQAIVSYDFNNENFEEDFCKWLISINFNYAMFFSYLTSLHQERLSINENIGARISYLSGRIKTYNQITTTTDNETFQEGPGIKNQITSWIYEELEHIQHIKISSQSIIEEPKSELPLEKIHLNLSVSDIAFILRALVDTKIIEASTHKALFSTISKVFKSKKREIISEGSLRSKFFSSNSEMKETGKHLSITMLNYFRSLPHN